MLVSSGARAYAGQADLALAGRVTPATPNLRSSPWTRARVARTMGRRLRQFLRRIGHAFVEARQREADRVVAHQQELTRELTRRQRRRAT